MATQRVMVKTGFSALDKTIKGLHASDLLVLASRPSQGKTALALNIAANIVLAKKPKAVLFISMEMNRYTIMQRLVAAEANVTIQGYRTGFFARKQWRNLDEAAARFAKAPLFIHDNPNMSVMDVCDISRQMATRLHRENKELGLIVIDDVRFMREASRGSARQAHSSKIARGLKHLARDLNVPVLAVSQLVQRLNKKSRAGTRPQMADLGEFSALGQHADVVALIFRENYTNRSALTSDAKAEILIEKNSRGKNGPIEVKFLREFAKFSNFN